MILLCIASRYIPDDAGKYTHIGDGFRGLYTGGGGQYTGTPSRGDFGGSSGGVAADRFRVTPVTTKPSPRPLTTPVLITAPTRPSTPAPPPPPPPPSPSPPVQRVSAVANDGRSNGALKIIRQENEVTADGYHYLYNSFKFSLFDILPNFGLILMMILKLTDMKRKMES